MDESPLSTSSSSSKTNPSKELTPSAEIGVPPSEEAPKISKRATKKKRLRKTRAHTQTEFTPEPSEEVEPVTDEKTVPTPVVSKAKTQNTSLLKRPIGKAIIAIALISLIVAAIGLWKRFKRNNSYL